MAAALAVLPAYSIASAGPEGIETILTEAYGPELAGKCMRYLAEEDISPQQERAVREAVTLIVQAGYPETCALEYFKRAAELSEADIGLGDLTNRIREGVAKKADGPRLLHVLGRRTSALREGKTLTLQLEREGVLFLDRQMAYTVFADYLLRGVNGSDLAAGVRNGKLNRYPALENVIR